MFLKGLDISQMSLTTPALLFPAISLLLLAYTNRFLALAHLIRQLSQNPHEHKQTIILPQIKNLKKRIVLIKNMQILGVGSFLLCTLSMFAVFIEKKGIGEIVFGLSLIILSVSLLFSLYEIAISMRALNIALDDMTNSQDQD